MKWDRKFTLQEAAAIAKMGEGLLRKWMVTMDPPMFVPAERGRNRVFGKDYVFNVPELIAIYGGHEFRKLGTNNEIVRMAVQTLAKQSTETIIEWFISRHVYMVVTPQGAAVMTKPKLRELMAALVDVEAPVCSFLDLDKIIVHVERKITELSAEEVHA